MEKKQKTPLKPTTAPAADRPAAPKKTTKHVNSLLELPRTGVLDFFAGASVEELLTVFDESYASDLVNVLLDLPKATVRDLLMRVYKLRKRRAAEVSTLYYYKDYLTNPLPLELETEGGAKLPNYYAILGVPRDAKPEDLKEAYRLLSRAHDPDMFSPPRRKVGDERRQEIIDSYSHLKNPLKRDKTDKLLPNIGYLYPRRDQSWFESVRRILI